MTAEMWLKSGEMIQFFGGIFMVITYIPQITLLLRTKSAENQSISFWTLLIVSEYFEFIYIEIPIFVSYICRKLNYVNTFPM